MMVSRGFNACSTMEFMKPTIDYTADWMINAFYLDIVCKCMLLNAQLFKCFLSIVFLIVKGLLLC